MPRTITFTADAAARVVALDETAQRYNNATLAFEAHDDANWSDYLITPTQLGTSKTWKADVPDDTAMVQVFAGASPLVTDSPSHESAVESYVADIDAAALAKFVTQDTGEVAAAGGSVAKLAGEAAAGAAGSVIPVSQEKTPPSLTWTLQQTPYGLLGDRTITVRVGEAKLMGLDFRHDLPTNYRLANVSAASIVSGTAGGVTWNLANAGVDQTQARIRFTAVTAGAYTLNVVVVDQNGNTREANVTLAVVA